MDDNSKFSSPIDLGKLIIDGNHNMLNSGSDQSDKAKNVLVGLISTLAGNQNQDSLAPSPTGLPQAAIDAATKVQKEYYTKHAEDAVASSPEGIAVLNHLIDTHNNAMQQQEQPAQQIAPQQPSNNYSYKPDNPISSFFNMFGIQPSPDAQVLLSQAQLNRQKLAGEEPLQQSQYQQAVLDTQQKINQAIQVPPTQAEKMQTGAAVYGHQVTALNDMYQKSLDEIQKSNEEIKNLGEYRSWIGKPFGLMPTTVQKKFKENALLHAQAATIADKLYGVASSGPQNKTQDQSQSNKVGKYTFTK